MNTILDKVIKYAQGDVPKHEIHKTLTPEILSDLIDRYGATVGTKHKRIFIPNSALDKDDLIDMGFRFSIGIPEKGSNILSSYKHKGTNLHTHQYDDGWTMHRDKSSPSLKHVVAEGIPAIYYNLVKTKGRMIDNVKRNTDNIMDRISDYMGPAYA